jgi:hypothetical protein
VLPELLLREGTLYVGFEDDEDVELDREGDDLKLDPELERELDRESTSEDIPTTRRRYRAK